MSTKFVSFHFHILNNLKSDNGQPITACYASSVDYTIGNYYRLLSGRYKAASYIFKPGYGTSCDNEEQIFNTELEARDYIKNRAKELIKKYIYPGEIELTFNQ